MKKVGRETRLIAYDTDANIVRRAHGQSPVYKLIRARTMLYVGIIAIVGGVMLFTLLTRSDLGVSAIHDRNPLYVELSDGSVRNSFTLRLVNKAPRERQFSISTTGVEGLSLSVVGMEPRPDGSLVISVGPDQTREVRLHASAKDQRHDHTRDLQFIFKDLQTGETALARDHFMMPER